MSELNEKLATAWEGFTKGDWQNEVNVRDFIQKNYTPYEGDESFLAGATEATTTLWDKVMEGVKLENRTHAPVDFDTAVASTITSHDAGYINKQLEKIVGLQTEAPLKRALIPFGGIKMIEGSCKAYNRELDPMIKKIFTEYRKTHNQGVFDVYTPDILRCRKSGVLTGLPDAYGRGRIIGDYRRVALYGIDYLMKDKLAQFTSLQADLENGVNLEQTIRLREEIAEQHRALGQMKEMAAKYGYDISGPATNAQEAIQWTYFGYLAAVKSQNGAAMSFGRTSTFLDVYIERDLKAGKITEQEAQEMVDHLVMKLRMVRFLRTPEYDELFSGDPIWATESIGGMGLDGRTLVTKNSFRFLNTLYTMGPSPEPNMTILWSEKLPLNFKKFAAKVSIDTSSLQYENDDLMRPDFNNDDYAIACCVSPMIVGKQMQFFGARANLAKTMLYAINGGVDEKLKPLLALADQEVRVTRAESGEMTASIRSEELEKFLVKKVEGLKDPQVSFEDDAVRVQGRVKLGGLVSAQADVRGHFGMKGSKLMFIPSSVTVEGMGMQISTTQMASADIYDFAGFPLGIQPDSVTMRDGLLTIHGQVSNS